MGSVGDTAGRSRRHGQSAGTEQKRHATLRCGAASLTATACRAEFKHHGGRYAEEGVR
ncbi:DUF6380 family protein [Streptomyces sp. NPDC001388]|uniref:DUF6380 family protein n=1 Tax=Streptomyces sp. NPDC001388 TaxID=3364568 RepID=UPI00367E03A4